LMLRRQVIAADFYANHIEPFPAAHEVLQNLRDKDLKIALATSSVRAIVAPFLERWDLTRFFSLIVTGDEISNGKPAPDIYLAAARGIGVQPENCLVVEDALAGVRAGKSAGCLVAAIPDERWAKREDYHGLADFLLDDLGGVTQLAHQLTGGDS